MTPRTIESLFAEALEKQSTPESEYDLTLDGPITKQILPRVIHAELSSQHDPDFVPTEVMIPGYSYLAFDSIEKAQASYPQVETCLAKPWAFWKFLAADKDIIFNFSRWGAVVVSKNNLPAQETTLRRHILGQWLSYAVSPELWGPQGKWTRFHERLKTHFHAASLSEEELLPGYYRLKSKASLLHDKGFLGTHLDKSYLLVLPWSFSLSALERLENTIRQEF